MKNLLFGLALCVFIGSVGHAEDTRLEHDVHRLKVTGDYGWHKLVNPVFMYYLGVERAGMKREHLTIQVDQCASDVLVYTTGYKENRTKSYGAFRIPRSNLDEYILIQGQNEPQEVHVAFINFSTFTTNCRVRISTCIPHNHFSDCNKLAAATPYNGTLASAQKDIKASYKVAESNGWKKDPPPASFSEADIGTYRGVLPSGSIVEYTGYRLDYFDTTVSQMDATDWGATDWIFDRENDVSHVTPDLDATNVLVPRHPAPSFGSPTEFPDWKDSSALGTYKQKLSWCILSPNERKMALQPRQATSIDDISDQAGMVDWIAGPDTDEQKVIPKTLPTDEECNALILYDMTMPYHTNKYRGYWYQMKSSELATVCSRILKYGKPQRGALKSFCPLCVMGESQKKVLADATARACPSHIRRADKEAAQKARYLVRYQKKYKASRWKPKSSFAGDVKKFGKKAIYAAAKCGIAILGEAACNNMLSKRFPGITSSLTCKAVMSAAGSSGKLKTRSGGNLSVLSKKFLYVEFAACMAEEVF